MGYTCMTFHGTQYSRCEAICGLISQIVKGLCYKDLETSLAIGQQMDSRNVQCKMWGRRGRRFDAFSRKTEDRSDRRPSQPVDPLYTVDPPRYHLKYLLNISRNRRLIFPESIAHPHH